LLAYGIELRAVCKISKLWGGWFQVSAPRWPEKYTRPVWRTASLGEAVLEHSLKILWEWFPTAMESGYVMLRR
jgi:hypothetical protein